MFLLFPAQSRLHLQLISLSTLTILFSSLGLSPLNKSCSLLLRHLNHFEILVTAPNYVTPVTSLYSGTETLYIVWTTIIPHFPDCVVSLPLYQDSGIVPARWRDTDLGSRTMGKYPSLSYEVWGRPVNSNSPELLCSDYPLWTRPSVVSLVASQGWKLVGRVQAPIKWIGTTQWHVYCNI